MKRLFILMLCCTIFSTLSAQENVFPATPYTDLYAIDVENDHLYAVGRCQTGIVSNDGGATKEYFQMPNNNSVTALSIVPQTDGEQAYIATRSELFIIDNNKNISTVDIAAVTGQGFIRGLEVTDSKIYLVADGAIFSSQHGSADWTKLADVLYNEDYFITKTSISASKLFIGSSMGHVFATDLSAGGYDLLSSVGQRVSALEMASDNVGYMVNQNTSEPYRTADGGVTWTSITDWPENNRILLVYSEDVFMTSNTNRYFVSTDGGETVTSIWLNDEREIDLLGAGAYDENGKLFLCGRSTTILTSEDFGQTFTNVEPRYRDYLNDLEFMGDFGISQGTNAIFETNDKGINWTSQSFPSLFTEQNYLDAAVIMAPGKYAIGHSDGVSIIENGVIQSTTGTSCNDLYYDSEKDFLITCTYIGQSNVIAKSTDGGLTWSNKVFAQDYIDKIKVSDDGTLYTAVSRNGYYRSTDDGETWELIDPGHEGWISDITYLGAESLYSINGKLYLSTDSGETLQEIASGYGISNLHIVEPGHYLYTTGSNSQTNIYEKMASDNNFSIVASSCGESNNSYLDGNTIWFNKIGGYIARHEVSLSTATVDVDTKQLYAYPNPIVAGNDINIPNQLGAKVTMRSLIGKVIFESVIQDTNGKVKTTGIPAGTYILTAMLDGNISTTKVSIF